MAELTEGAKAPEISLLDDAGRAFKLSSLKGQNVVLYFYPKADTPGCTKEACEFRDRLPSIKKAGTAVVGASPDPVSAVAKFKQKFELNFPAAGRRRPPGGRGVRRLEREEHVRQEVHGCGAHNVHHRQGRQDRKDLSEGQSRWARRRSDGRPDELVTHSEARHGR